MKTNQKLWIVMTNNGIAWQCTDPNFYGKDLRGKFANWCSKSLGFVPAFKNKSDAFLFARKARKSHTVSKAWIQEVKVI